ncbi:sugar ABC transporter permease [Staphylococcus equorum]|uniref:sugar ABC transporter permease n=1 Tax=Staphylococcus equorum TaxID=246432 RepID=UPI000853B3A5|nr:sugar ABC transporter permease [Staphylococcus equorum]OEK65627.1 sugar ABC transporter permease [Staphylococcus equorum]OEK72048.1 sugar ABC transporter permease [Staphylococcus equorum]
MIDSIISFFKNMPYLSKQAYHRLKSQWVWLVIPFLSSLALLFLLMLIFKINGTEELIQARAYFRLAGLTTFAYIWIAVYRSYKTYKIDYFTSKLFNLNPIFQNVVIAIITSITMFITLIIMIYATPVNIESSITSTFYYVVMSMLFMILVSTILGLSAIVRRKINGMFYVISLVMFFIVPILFIPTSNTSLVSHILMLNPLYYLIEGISQSVVLGALSLNNIPYHLYYILFLAILCVVIFAKYRIMAHRKYLYAVPDETIVAHSDTDKDENTNEADDLSENK